MGVAVLVTVALVDPQLNHRPCQHRVRLGAAEGSGCPDHPETHSQSDISEFAS